MIGVSALRAWWTECPPATGAAVMATGIVSVGLHLAGAGTPSLIVLVPACVAWVAPAAAFVVRLVRHRRRWAAEARSLGALTAVALLALDLAWCVVLVVTEVTHPRLRYDLRRWATVFPLGVTAAATLSVADALGIDWLKGPGRVLV
ncbi:SLAC1 family transporter [Streptomyces sp. NPDC002520]